MTCDGNPIDTLLLSVFSGKLTESSKQCIGIPFLNYKWLVSQYKCVEMTVPFDVTANFEGKMRTTIWHKKSLAQLEKEREKLKGKLVV